MIIHRNIGKRTGSANLTLREKKKKKKKKSSANLT